MEQKILSKNFIRNNYLKFGFALALCYMGCYTGKTILSAISPMLQSQNVFNAGDIGNMGFAMFIAYGIGQLINGMVGDILNPKDLALLGLSSSGVLVCMVPLFQPNIALSTVLWAMIGFFASMMWGPLTKIIAENSEGDTSRKLMLALNASLVLGTMMAYVIASVVSANFGWQIAFYAAGGYMLFCAVVYYVVLTTLEKKHIIVCAGIRTKNVERKESTEKLSKKILFKNGIITAVLYCMMNGFIRNAVTFWIPTYIKQTFNVSDSFASTITIILPIFNFLGTLSGIMMLKLKIFRGSENILSAVLFILATLMFAVIVILNGSSLVMTVICLFLAAAAMNSVCNLIYAVYVFRYKATGRISTLTGAMDCSAYIASGVGTKCIGLIVEAIGWNDTVLVWSAIAVTGAVACIITGIICKKNGAEAAM